MILSSSRPLEIPARANAWLRRSSALLLVVSLAGCGAAPIEPFSLTTTNLANQLLVHWPFDETGGMMVGDSSGNGHIGLITGDTFFTWVPNGGRFGGGLQLKTGASVTSSNFPQATTDWTVSVWIKQSEGDKAALINESRAVLLSTERPSMGGWEIEFDPRPGFEYLEVSYFASGGYPILNYRPIEIDRWTQFTAVFDGTNGRFSLYRDGLPVDSATMPGPILTGDSTLNIGRWMQGDRPISGVIDDYAIWTRALTADEVATLHVIPAPDSL